jgi:hypothetical protein
MMKWKLSILFALICVFLFGQNELQINGLNEAQFVYRTAEDSLSAYFSNSFGFHLGYRDFRFGMKFNSELPKYTNQESELLTDLDPNRLSVAWEELYAGYQKDAFNLHVGTTEETFGQGITFRSFEDIEFDEDHRLESFFVSYDDKLKLKAFYGAIESQSYAERYDLAYGADLQYPLWQGLRLGASALGYRELGAFSHYRFRDVFSSRALFSYGNLDSYAEYAIRLPGSKAVSGSAIYANADYMLGDLILGGAYKRYQDFFYRLQDLPLANHHSETLSDAQASGLDEEGWQARAMYNLSPELYLSVDYAEAWDQDQAKRMNDLYLAVDMMRGMDQYQLSYSHTEKLDEDTGTWQKETYPAFAAGFQLSKFPMQLSGEFKTVEKQKDDKTNSHYEPAIQTDISLGKLSLALGLQSWWADFSSIMDSRYMPNIEVKYPIFSHSDLLVFAGKEAGGKVCRNGVCRFVAPFEGVRAELSTRF